MSELIEKQAVIDALLAKMDTIDDKPEVVLGLAVAAGMIKDMPSVTPAEKVGLWEWVQYDSNPNIGNWHCSECRTIIPHMPEETDNTPIYKWCPMCGSKMMQEVDDDE